MDKICPICNKTIETDSEEIICSDCGKVYHTECWNGNGGCIDPECPKNAKSEQETSESPSETADCENDTATENAVTVENTDADKKDETAGIKIKIPKKWWLWAIIGVIVISIILISTCSKTENARAVINQIKNVSDEVNSYSDDSIKSVEEQYEALTDKEKKQINNYDDLIDARNECDELIADGIENQIDGLSSDSDIDRIKRVHSEYDELTENQKKYVLNYKKLEQAEENYYNGFITAAEDAISAIEYSGGKITDEQSEAIETAIEACGEVPDAYQKKISNYKTLVKAMDDRDSYYLETAQKLIDNAIEKNKGFENAEKAYNALSLNVKNKIENYDKFSEMYTAYKNKPPVKIVSYRVGENIIGCPEIYIAAKNVSGKIIKEFNVAFFAWDKDGVPVSLGYNDYMRTLNCDEALKVNATLPGNVCWTFYGMYDKSDIQQAVIVVRDVEYFDGTTWENPNYGSLCDKYCQQLLEKGDANIAKRG